MNLKERARLAYLDRQAMLDRALTESAVAALSEVVGDSFEWTVTKIVHATTSTVEIECDGITFKVIVYDSGTTTVHARRNGTDQKVESLADIGQVFKDEPLGEPENDPQPKAAAMASRSSAPEGATRAADVRPRPYPRMWGHH